MNRIASFIYWMNKIAAFVMSAMMSFLFYSSLAGSDVFFYWFNGVSGVVFDVKRVQLWGDGKKKLALVFVLISIIAFVGSSVSETLKASYRELNTTYVNSLKANISEQDQIIATQKKRIAETPDTMAPEKETRMLNEAIANRDKYQKELLQYENDNTSDESMTQFQIIADKTGIDVRIIIWVFFIIRATLLEVSVLYDSKKKEDKKYSYSEKKIEIDVEKRNIIFDWINRWKEKAVTDNKVEVVGRLNSLTEYIGKLEDISKEELYVKEDIKERGVGNIERIYIRLREWINKKKED